MNKKMMVKVSTRWTLLECPFCGAHDARIVSSKHELGALTHFGMCMSCGAKGPMERSAENAAEEWNRRDGVITE